MSEARNAAVRLDGTASALCPPCDPRSVVKNKNDRQKENKEREMI